MAKVIPFCGARYNSQKVGDIAGVIAPPYDVIETDQRLALEEKHPNNIVRLILNQAADGDTATDNQYTRAAELLKRWMAAEVFIRDALPCYYVYDQTFTTPHGGTYTRRALIGNGRLESFDAGVVFPHERTLAAPKADRLKLMRECHANLSPIFLLYSDAEGVIEALLARSTAANLPRIDLPEMFGSTHRLWRIDDAAVNRQIQSHLASKSLVIADGHHRYETALAFRDEIRARTENWTGEEPYNYMMMNLVRMESPGLVVLATHRLLSGLNTEQIAQAMDRLPEYFDVKGYPNLSDLLEHLHTFAGKRPAFGMYTYGDDRYWLLISEIDSERDLDVTRSTAYNQLDVTILHTFFLKKLFGIDTTIPSHQQLVSYAASTEKAIQYASAEEGRVALLMNPTPVSQVYAVATSGETMPQKSTYFYPKMATGLVLNLLGQL